jgi:energy-coupling factor transport system permease protein
VTRTAALGTWVASGLVLVLACNQPLARLAVLAAAWVLLIRGRLAGRRARPLAIGLAALGLGAVAINGVLSHEGVHVLARLPGWLPAVGGEITVEAFAYGADVALGLLGAISVAALLSYLLEATELVDALPGFLARTGAALGSALNLLPSVAGSFAAVRDAQRLRGWRPRGVRAWVDVLVPVLLRSIETSVALAESMEARAFGSGPRTRLATGSRSPRNATVAAGALLAVAAFLTARLAGRIAAWYPYPTPTPPSVAPAVLGPPVLLAAAGLLLPRGRGLP